MRNLKIKNIDCHAALAMTKNAQSGRSMIEMLGVLAIIGVLSVGGIAGYSKAMTKYRINKTIEQITLIAGNIRAFFAPQKSYNGVDNNTIIRKAKLVPEEMWNTDDTGFTNVFGGRASLGRPNFTYHTYNEGFKIEYNIGDNEEACIELLTQDWTTADFQFIYLGGVGPTPSKFFHLPVSVDVAVNNCYAVIDVAKNFAGAYIIFYSKFNLNQTDKEHIANSFAN